jgi:2-hydroxychromene-2-carboxylate isomerase
MQQLVFHFDFISPFAYLAFERLPQVLQGCSYVV